MFNANRIQNSESSQNTPFNLVERRNMFIEQAEEANPEVDNLARKLSSILQRIGAVKQMMAKESYPGKLSDLNELESEREILVSQINAHPDKKSVGGFNNLSGGRQETVFRKLNS